MKKLDFAQFGDRNKRNTMFGLLWTAYRATYPKMAAGYENMKLCNRIGEMLEAMSYASPDTRDETARTMSKDVLLMEGMEFAKLVAMVKSEEVGWGYLAGRNVELLVEAMQVAPEVEVEEKKKDKAREQVAEASKALEDEDEDA